MNIYKNTPTLWAVTPDICGGRPDPASRLAGFFKKKGCRPPPKAGRRRPQPFCFNNPASRLAGSGLPPHILGVTPHILGVFLLIIIIYYYYLLLWGVFSYYGGYFSYYGLPGVRSAVGIYGSGREPVLDEGCCRS